MKGIALAALAVLLQAVSLRPGPPAVLGPFSTADNFSTDLLGVPDTRPTTWGDAAAAQHPFTFVGCPKGYRVRILRTYGNWMFFPSFGLELQPDTAVEVGWGLKTTAPDGSVNVNYGYDNTFLWVQSQITHSGAPQPVPVNYDTSAGGLLGPDNTVISQSFVGLNNTGLTVHLEDSLVYVYQFERDPQQ